MSLKGQIVVETTTMIIASHGEEQIRALRNGQHYNKTSSNVYKCRSCDFQAGNHQLLMEHFIEKHTVLVEPLNHSINDILRRKK
ncbi:MAG: hypothetical protein ACFFD4_08065 [Candidatus Odinarchaeota archaeon]